MIRLALAAAAVLAMWRWMHHGCGWRTCDHWAGDAS